MSDGEFQPAPFDLARFSGEWHVTGSTFPMWLSGRRRQPRFRYGLLPGGRLSDEVLYLTASGSERAIRGIDTRLDRPGVVFQWRGKGLLAPLTSEWAVTEYGPGYDWAIITFSKSLFTPAGVDFICRDVAMPLPTRYPQLKDLRNLPPR